MAQQTPSLLTPRPRFHARRGGRRYGSRSSHCPAPCQPPGVLRQREPSPWAPAGQPAAAAQLQDHPRRSGPGRWRRWDARGPAGRRLGVDREPAGPDPCHRPRISAAPCLPGSAEAELLVDHELRRRCRVHGPRRSRDRGGRAPAAFVGRGGGPRLVTPSWLRRPGGRTRAHRRQNPDSRAAVPGPGSPLTSSAPRAAPGRRSGSTSAA